MQIGHRQHAVRLLTDSQRRDRALRQEVVEGPFPDGEGALADAPQVLQPVAEDRRPQCRHHVPVQLAVVVAATGQRCQRIGLSCDGRADRGGAEVPGAAGEHERAPGFRVRRQVGGRLTVDGVGGSAERKHRQFAGVTMSREQRRRVAASGTDRVENVDVVHATAQIDLGGQSGLHGGDV